MSRLARLGGCYSLNQTQQEYSFMMSFMRLVDAFEPHFTSSHLQHFDLANTLDIQGATVVGSVELINIVLKSHLSDIISKK